jgi:hypothetical protein
VVKRALLIAALAACGQKSDPPAPQTFGAAMELLCSSYQASGASAKAPADRDRAISAWVVAHVTEPRTLALLDQLGQADDGGKRVLLDGAAKEAGLATCPLRDGLVPFQPLPHVVGPIDPIPDRVAQVVLSPTATFAELLEQASKPGVLIVANADGPGALPLVLGGSTGDSLVVAITASDLRVFSLDGRHGTIGKPAWISPQGGDPSLLDRALADIADEPRVVVMAEGSTPLSTVAQVIATAHAHFPRVELSRGFD